ncbi:hypothetical protein B566_EDAN013096 [Ephemera danica]|nr:hypothetical protein B566_EDAN013096 [Ephemera danica]
MAATFTQESAGPSAKLTAGPHGLGDPTDKTLRKVEVEVLIPKVMRERAKAEKCIPEVQAFSDCCSGASLAMVISCRRQNDALRDCLTHWYNDEQFKSECKQQYLKERSEFRRTGLQKKIRDAIRAEDNAASH